MKLHARIGSLVIVSLLAMGCALEEAPPAPGPTTSVNPDEPTGEPRVNTQDDDLEGETCDEGDERSCKVILESHGDTQNCFVGVQFCEDGEWSPCDDDDEDGDGDLG
jgi:hypothetical protein